jgi:hypothetical protein
MAQDPKPENACDWQEPFISHMGSVNGPNPQKEPLSTIGCAASPTCANLACVAGLEPATPAAVYHLRGSDSDLP